MKNRIRSLRFDDELFDAINRQVGDSFQSKFESMVYRCLYELPAKEALLAELDRLIEDKRKELYDLSVKARQYSNKLDRIADYLRGM